MSPAQRARQGANPLHEVSVATVRGPRPHLACRLLARWIRHPTSNACGCTRTCLSLPLQTNSRLARWATPRATSTRTPTPAAPPLPGTASPALPTPIHSTAPLPPPPSWRAPAAISTTGHGPHCRAAMPSERERLRLLYDVSVAHRHGGHTNAYQLASLAGHQQQHHTTCLSLGCRCGAVSHHPRPGLSQPKKAGPSRPTPSTAPACSPLSATAPSATVSTGNGP